MFNRNLLFSFTLPALLLAAIGCSRLTQEAVPSAIQSMSTVLPGTFPVTSTDLACQAISSSIIEQQPEDVAAGRLIAHVQKASDKLAVKIKGDRLSFMTVASVEAGQAEGAEFLIVKDTEDYLMAVHLSEGGLTTSLNTFVLNRKNGLAAWTKSRPSFLTIETPDTHSVYLVCR